MRQWLVRIVALVFACGSVATWAAVGDPVEGQDYSVLSPAQATSNPGKIVVTEFFSYECPHCFAFFPLVSSWAAKQPKDVVFERVPVSFGRSSWAAIAQAFYALQALDKVDKLDSAIFNAIHVQNVKLVDEASITDWMVKQGISKQEFSSAYNSFSVKSNMSRAEQAVRANQIQGVPTLVVDGKYVVSSTKDHEGQLIVADKLIAKVRADKAHK
jgi:thiol:disulfide interchange protein DsbA